MVDGRQKFFELMGNGDLPGLQDGISIEEGCRLFTWGFNQGVKQIQFENEANIANEIASTKFWFDKATEYERELIELKKALAPKKRRLWGGVK